MKYCTHCGEQIDDEAVFCVHCGKAVKSEGNYSAPKIKYCGHCGSELKEGADFCINCGCRATPEPVKETKGYDKDKILTTIAKVFMVISCAEYGIIALTILFIASLCGFDVLLCGLEGLSAFFPTIIFFFIYSCAFLIPLAWCIPMTVSVFKSSKENKPISTGFKVCVLIFVNLVAGILLLCRSEPDNGQA